jgi:hypothetical protein
MEIELAEVIVEACVQNGVKAEVQKNYSASWMRGRKTTGVVIVEGDLALVLTAIIANTYSSMVNCRSLLSKKSFASVLFDLI